MVRAVRHDDQANQTARQGRALSVLPGACQPELLPPVLGFMLPFMAIRQDELELQRSEVLGFLAFMKMSKAVLKRVFNWVVIFNASCLCMPCWASKKGERRQIEPSKVSKGQLPWQYSLLASRQP